jgi:hypothetical protein
MKYHDDEFSHLLIKLHQKYRVKIQKMICFLLSSGPVRIGIHNTPLRHVRYTVH